MKFTYPDKTLVAIIAIFLLEALAIINHINGALFGIAIATIAGLGGFAYRYRSKPK